MQKVELYDKLKIYIAGGGCCTLKEIEEALGIDEGTALVYLSRLAKKHVITRKWTRDYQERKVRLYCISSGFLKEIGLS
jgi:DNA-binding MarR family transcriptional regulator